MDVIYRPLKDHKCTFLDGRDYCSTCIAHALDPSNTIVVKEIPPLIKWWAIATMLAICAALFSTNPACTYPEQKPTRLMEIHNESIHPQPLPDPSPLDKEDEQEITPTKSTPRLHYKESVVAVVLRTA